MAGKFVTIDGKVVFIGGPSQGSGSAGATQQSHTVSLPSNPKKITINQAAEALNQMGYSMQHLRTSPDDWMPVWEITDTTGKKQEMTSAQLKKFVYDTQENE